MIDILPPKRQDRDRAVDARSKNVRETSRVIGSRDVSTRDALTLYAGPRVLRIDWKLPARLRKPIGEQLKKERNRLAKLRPQVFTRRALQTRPVFQIEREAEGNSRKVRIPRSRLFGLGAESHTGDVYRSGKPKIKVMAPPYVGAALQQKAFVPRREPASNKIFKNEKNARNSQRLLPLPDRDVPYSLAGVKGPASGEESFDPGLFVEVGEKNIQRRSFLFPFMISFIPKFLSRRMNESDTLQVHRESQVRHVESENVAQSTSKPVQITTNQTASQFDFERELTDTLSPHSLKAGKKKRFDRIAAGNSAALALFCVVSVSLFWMLQAFGRGYAAVQVVQEYMGDALGKMTLAQASLARADFSASGQYFQDAQELIANSRTTYDESFKASQFLLHALDVSGALKSGSVIIDVGADIVKAGEHLSQGLKKLTSENIQETALLERLRFSAPEFARASNLLASVENRLQIVRTDVFPRNVQEHVETLRAVLPQAKQLVSQLELSASFFLHMLGDEKDRDILFVFANNHELRPIGGYLGTIALVHARKGVFENIDIESVYEGDGQLKTYIAPPDPLRSIVDRWYLRDSNWFVDFEVSAKKISSFFEREGGPTVDSVILITPDVVKRLLAITGPLRVKGYDEVVTADSFVPVTQGYVTYSFDRTSNRPKQFIADLTPVLLGQLFDHGSEKMRAISSALAESLKHKELLIYVRDERLQQRLHDVGVTGGIPIDQKGFLYVNNANIGGHKSDQFVDQEIDYRSTILDNGDVDVVLTIRRTHHGPTEALSYPYPENEDPAYKDNIVYQRVFVPMGSKLIEASGFAVSPKMEQKKSEKFHAVPYIADADVVSWQQGQSKHATGTMIGKEASYTFFANWQVTTPGQTTVGLYHYTIPRHADLPGVIDSAASYVTPIIKQPGDTRTVVRVLIRIPSQFRIVHGRPSHSLSKVNEHEILYQGPLDQDVAPGVVFEL